MKKFNKGLMAAVLTGGLLVGSMQAEAASSFLSEVPASDWSYSAVNKLIATGNVKDYTEKIPEGRVMSRMEMAMIVDDAMNNLKAFSPADQEAIQKLNKEYYYDIKKVQMLSKLDNAELDKAASEVNGTTFTKEETAGLKKAAALAEKLEVGGYLRYRYDHYLTNKGNGGSKSATTTRKLRADMASATVNMAYKVNDNTKIHTDITYRHSMGAVVNKNLKWGPGESGSGMNFDVYATGQLDKKVDYKIGKWNEWNPFGWGMDIDCDFVGGQFSFGKKLKTFFTTGKMDLWDYAMTYNTSGSTGDRDDEEVTSLRWFYPFDDKNDINFGMSYSSGMTSRYQDPSSRVFYYYAHGHHKFDKNWDVRAGLINSNASRDPNNAYAGTKTKQPGRWLQVTYKKADKNVKGSFDIYAIYRYEPALTWPTVTDWCGQNERLFRLGADYVLDKNIVFNTMYTWAREIDTGARNDLYRFQVDMYF